MNWRKQATSLVREIKHTFAEREGVLIGEAARGSILMMLDMTEEPFGVAVVAGVWTCLCDGDVM